MTDKELLSAIDYLYNKYGVKDDFYINLSDNQKPEFVKGILAELDRNKNKDYAADDTELIKDIYFFYC